MSRPVDPAEHSGLDERVLVLAATGRDAALTKSLFTSAGIATAVCSTLTELLSAVATG